jgi:site-specific recombinase XerD
MVLYGTGMRRSEQARLKSADIDSQRNLGRPAQARKALVRNGMIPVILGQKGASR